MNRIKVLFLIYQLQEDGVTKALENIMQMLRNTEKFEVEIYTIAQTSYYKNLGVPITFLYSSEKELWKAIKNQSMKLSGIEKFDVVVAYSCVFCAELLAQSRVGARKIAWIHTDINKLIKYYSLDYIQEIYRKFDEIICVSESVKETAAKVFLGDIRERLRVIYNPINRFEIVGESLVPIEQVLKKPFIIAIGRLSSEKGFKKLINVYARLLKEGIENNLIILGEGEQREELEKLITLLEIGDRCQLKGYVSNPYNWIRSSQIVVSSSEGEGLPLNLMEAMLLHKPIVATRVMGNEELLEQELGLLVEPTEEGLFEGLKQMLCDVNCSTKYVQNLRDKGEFEFESTHILQQIEKLLSMK